MNFLIKHFNGKVFETISSQANEKHKKRISFKLRNNNFTKNNTNNVIYAGKETFRQSNENFSNLCDGDQGVEGP